ncbi:MAG: hypothetical protein IPP40_14150 [bacterium]|nr:hypothetical protein [bacterium]
MRALRGLVDWASSHARWLFAARSSGYQHSPHAVAPSEIRRCAATVEGPRIALPGGSFDGIVLTGIFWKSVTPFRWSSVRDSAGMTTASLPLPFRTDLAAYHPGMNLV